MIHIDYVQISESKKPEENIKTIKAYLDEQADMMNLYFSQLEDIQRKLKESEGK